MQRTKICTHCGKEKPATERYFDVHLRTPDRLKPYCRTCSPFVVAERRKRKTEKSHEWAKANQDKVKESSRRNYERNRRERLAYMKRWREVNKEHIRAYQRTYAERASRVTANDV